MRLSSGRARDLFAAARVARLATVGEQGVPRLVPVTFAVMSDIGGRGTVDDTEGYPVDDAVGDTVVTAVDHKPKATLDLRRLRDIAENPRVCLLVDHYEDDWEQLWWVRADGHARIVAYGPERERAVSRLAERYSQYRERPPEGAAILIEVDRWTGWSYAGDP